jgi:lysophospholipase L1-like esterase
MSWHFSGRIALAVASSAVALGLAELGARALWPKPSLPEEPLPLLQWQADLEQPHVRGVSQGVLFRTDRIGLRGPDYEAQPPNSVFRIVLGGDSIAMGHGVREEDRYSDRLARLLDAARPGVRHEVVNAGLSGLDAGGVMQRLEKVLGTYAGHLLVYGFCANDIEGPGYERVSPVWDVNAYWARVIELERSPLRLWSLVQGWLMRLWIGSPIDEDLLHNYLVNPAAWQSFTAQLDRLAALASQRGVCAHLLLQPQLQRLGAAHPYLDIYARVASAARERGISVSDAFPAFRGRFASWYWVSPFDTHPNARAHALLAQVLADDLLALPDSCWRPAPPASAASPR